MIRDEIVGYAFPSAVPVGPDGKRFVRHWIVRSARPVPSQEEAARWALRAEARAADVMAREYGATASADSLRRSRARVTASLLDSTHCVVSIELPSPGHAVGDAAGIGTYQTLRMFDELYGIEDLEGLPKHFWFFLK